MVSPDRERYGVPGFRRPRPPLATVRIGRLIKGLRMSEGSQFKGGSKLSNNRARRPMDFSLLRGAACRSKQ